MKVSGSQKLFDPCQIFAGERKHSRVASQDENLIERTQQDRFEASEAATESFTKGIKKSVALGGGLGAAAGLSLGLAASATVPVLAPIIVAGAAAGALFKYVTGVSSNSGAVNITFNGKTRQTQFKCDPEAFPYTREETRLLLSCQGKIGDELRPSTHPKVTLGDASALRAMAPFRAKFKDLGSQRRLAADFGGKTRYGHDSLDLIDAKTAAKTLASGQEIFVVSGHESEDLQHHLQSQSQSKNKNLASNHSYSVVERRFEYNLQKIDKVEQLSSVPPAQGAPQSMLAIYKDSDITTQIVKGASQSSEAKARGGNMERRQTFIEQGCKKEQLRGEVNKARVSLVRNDTNGAVALGFVGYIAGAAIATGFGLPAILGVAPAIALGAVGYNYMDKIIRQEQGRAVEG